jgi:hypothetical protein
MDPRLKFYLITATTINLILLAWAVAHGNTNIQGAEIPRRPIPPEIAVYCIIGEGENQGKAGMLALAQALNNRGTTRGVYGCNSARIKERAYSSKTFVQAVKAYWEDPNKPSLIGKANSWYSWADLWHDPFIFFRCQFQTKVKDHFFFYCQTAQRASK